MKEEQIFHEALEVVAERRAAFLDEACGQDADLRKRVEILLEAHANPGSFLGSPAPAVGARATLNQPAVEKPGTHIGPYKLLEQIGEGGFGVVYMAEQQRPVRRRVALKVIKPGFDTHQVIARFEAERQALALMDHENIAKVLDAGATDSGRPYFVMELVHGVPITDYCDRNQLPTLERLELFIQVCRAVQHAHAKGIIHRDIKPTNVLVTLHEGVAVPKVIDFGVAKATGQQLTEKTLFTNFAQMVGTPLYMSPEQAEMTGIDVDTRSDVYSLGVLLYELLTGTTPLDKDRLKQAAFDEVRRIIREEEPPRPSTRLSTMSDHARSVSAARRKSDPKQLGRLIRGELDWIVMKTLEKERARRYETPTGLAHDIERYLLNETVEACPPSPSYRLRKFVRRNRAVLVTVGLVAAALIVGTVVSVSQAVRATDAEALATARLNEATAARRVAEVNGRKARTAVDDMYTQVAEKWLAHQPKMQPIQREFLEKALKYYAEFAQESSNDPAVRFEAARAQSRVADIQHRLGEADQSKKSYEAAIHRLEALTSEFPKLPQYRQSLADALHRYGVVLSHTGERFPQAEVAHRRALALQEELAKESPSVVEYRRDLARGHWHLGRVRHDVPYGSIDRWRAVAESYRLALAIQQRLVEEFPIDPLYRQHLADTHLGLSRTARLISGPNAKERKTHEQRAVAILEELVEEFPAMPTYRSGLANAYWWLTLSPTLPAQEVEQLLRKMMPHQEKLAAEFPDVTDFRYDLIRTLFTLGHTLTTLDRPQQAEEAYRRAVVIGEKLVTDAPGVDYFQSRLVSVYSGLARLLAKTGRPEEAEKVYQQAIALAAKFSAQFPHIRGSDAVASAHLGFAQLLVNTGRTEQAQRHFEKVLQIASAKPNLLNHYAWTLATSKDLESRHPDWAVQLARKGVDLDPESRELWNTLGVSQYRAGDWHGAIESLGKSMKLNGDRAEGDASDWFFLAMAEWQLDNKDSARKWYQKAVEWMEENACDDEELVRFRAEAAVLLGIDSTHKGAE